MWRQEHVMKDRIDVSADAQLMAAALAAASDTPVIRQDVVDRAREKLAQGTLGADADALADALMDDALGKT
jgi:flagellar biosynthesis anti-sigma factor FlgM